jgi:Fic family protein
VQLVALYVLDFLCIHPFSDGNGRMVRLLTVLLLHREDYEVARYVALERLIEQSSRCSSGARIIGSTAV